MFRFRCTALIGILSLWALASQASGQTVSFRDESGAAASTYVEGGRAIVQVEDATANVLGSPDTVNVRLTSTRGGDEELLTLTETGGSSGIFRGEIRLAPANGSAQPGVLETAVDPNPPFDRDTIHAEYGTASATASMVGSKIVFLDEYGRPAPQVIAGGTIQVRVTAPLANLYPDYQDSVVATITTGNGDSEYVYLTETGFGTGVFEGSRPSTQHAAYPQDGFVDITPVGQTVTAEYSDMDFPTSSQASVPSVAGTVELIDAAGRPADFFLESSRAYVEVRSRPGAPAPQVKVTADLSGDVEILTLQEITGGIYRGSIPMRRGPAIPNNGILETTEADSPARFDTVRATQYPAAVTTDAVPTLGSLISFHDEYGNEVSRYAAGGTVVVRVEDHNFNDPGVFDSVQAVVQSLATGDAETLTLHELSRDSGLFEGKIASETGAAAPSDGRLQVQPGERIQAMHVDAFPQLASGALATIDLLKIQFIDETGRPTNELLPGGPVRVRVTAPGYNLNPSLVESFPVELASRYGADQETITVTETGPGTGVFEGTIPSLVPSLTPPDYSPTGQPGNGKLDLANSGPPDFGPEVVTASVGPYSAEIHTVPARVMFIDDYGRPTTSIPYGNQVRVRVIDYTRNDPQFPDLISIQIASGQDYEFLNLQETGYDTGVFEGTIQVTTISNRSYYDGRLSTQPGDTVTAYHQGYFGADMLTAQLRIAGGQVLFVDAAGQPTSVYLEGTQMRVRVIDQGANRDFSRVETVAVSLSTDLSGDSESLTLTETSSYTGIFEGMIPLRHGPVLPNSGAIEPGEEDGPPHHFDTVRVSYATSYSGEVSASSVGVQNFRVWFIDADGNVTDHYAKGSRLYVRVEDHRFDNPGAFDRETVILQSSSGDQESLELLETGRSTGIFEGSMPIDNGAPAGDGRLQADPGSEVTAVLDAGYTAEPARARIDALSIEFLDDAGHATTEFLPGGPVRVRVISSGDNADSSLVETIPVQLTSRYGADQETLQATETGPGTGVFEGMIPSLVPSLTPPDYSPTGQPGNGKLDLANSGPPLFGPEVVTASVGPYSAEAHTVAARLMFIDDYGRPTASFPFGSQVRVRLIDYTRNDPQFPDQVSIQIASANDYEYVYLQETGYNTGVFEGSIQTASSSYYYDGRLSTGPGATVTAYHGSYFSGEQITADAKITGGQALFVDDAGQPASVYLEGTRARVRVIDQGANRNAFQADTVTVSLATDLSGDTESLTLTETGTQTGIFEGTIPLRHGPVLRNSGAIEPGEDDGPPHQFDTLRVSYAGSFGGEVSTSSAGVRNFRVWFIDADGNVTDHYARQSRLYVRVEDHRFDDPGAFDHQAVLLQSSSGDVEALDVLETGKSTGIFEGSMPLDGGAPAGDHRLQADPGSQITAALAVGYTEQPARARIDALTIEFLDDAGHATTQFLAGGPVRVRVTSPGDNLDSSQVETIPLEIASRYALDHETVPVTETGPGSGVFEGTIPSRVPALTPPDYSPTGEPGNGKLELANSGPPEFGPEVVTASMGSYSAVATVVDSRLLFIDDYGRPTTTFPQGGQVRVRVIDYTQNNPEAQDLVSIQIGSAADFEYLNLMETGLDTGVFEGSIQTTSQVVYYNGELATAPGVTVTAYYAGYFDQQQRTADATITGGRVLFVDEAGQGTNVVTEGTQARLRVEDHGQSGSVTVQVTTAIRGDHESVTLQETGPGTGLFEGSISVAAAASAVPDNGVLETGRIVAPIVQDDVLTATYADATPAQARVEPGSGGGGETAVSFRNLRDQAVTTYSLGATVRVRVEDASLAGSGPLAVSLRSLANGDTETLSAAETSPGVFVGSLPSVETGGASGDGAITAGAGQTIEAGYGIVAARATFSSNQPPIVGNDEGTTLKNRSLVIAVLSNDGDPEGGQLSVGGVTQGAHGSVAINPDGTVTYTPAADYYGNDTFTYLAVDPDGGETVGTVTVTLQNGENLLPVAVDDQPPGVMPGDSVSVAVLANDYDQNGDDLKVVAVTQGAHGTVSIDADQKTLTYAAGQGFTGTDPFTYTISDGYGGTATATVFMPVGSINHPPVANDDTARMNRGGSITIDVLANDTDPDGDPLRITRVVGADLNPDQTVTYTPRPTYSGDADFIYEISDGRGGTATGHVTIFINVPPTANPDTATVAEDGTVAINVLANDTDPYLGPDYVAGVTQGSHGTVTINPDKTVQYTPAADFNGNDSFTYTASDGIGTGTGTVTVTVTPVNDVPVANADSVSVAEDGTISIAVLANDTDVDGDPLTVISITQGTHGTVAINPDKTVQYTPAANYNGSDSFTYTISDGNGGTATGTVAVDVTPVDDPPVAANDSATVAAGSAVTVSVLANDADIDGPALSVASVTQGAHGTVAINSDQTVTYTAGLYVGSDSFTYTVSDGAGGTATATVALNVTAPARVETGIQAHYDFNEGAGSTIHDTSGVGTPLDIAIGKLSATAWTAGGLTVQSNADLTSAGNATKIIGSAQASNSVTFEAWLHPSSLTLNNGRIAMISKNPAQRNLVFAQSADLYEAQVRTSAGTSSLQTPAGSASLDLVHVVYTRSSSGQAIYYINGVQVSSQTAAGNLSAWGADQKLILSENWQGTYFLLAVYGRDLSADEVLRNYLAGSEAN